MNNVISNLISMLIGALVTWLAAWYYYKKVGRELREEAAKLNKLSTIMLRAMEDAGLVSLNENDSGEIAGRKISLSGLAVGTGTGSMSMVVQRNLQGSSIGASGVSGNLNVGSRPEPVSENNAS